MANIGTPKEDAKAKPRKEERPGRRTPSRPERIPQEKPIPATIPIPERIPLPTEGK